LPGNKVSACALIFYVGIKKIKKDSYFQVRVFFKREFIMRSDSSPAGVLEYILMKNKFI